MNALHVLMPPLARLESDPAFRRWLVRGNRLDDVPDARVAGVREVFRFAGAALPVAALRHHCHADDAALGAWVCADPAYARSEATGARLMACPVDDLTDDESRELAAALQPLFGDAGVPLEADTPTAWCARVTQGAPLPDFVAPADALGVDLLECLPAGDAGRSWRHLFNEAQMMLHAHSVNAARKAAGKLPVNALWFWGAGTLPDTVAASVQVAASVDDCLRGLAWLAGVDRATPLPDAFDATPGSALLDLDIRGHADEAARWLEHFRAWLRTRRFGTIRLTFADGPRFDLRHAHRLRFWRRG